MKRSGGPKMGREGFPRELEQPMLGHGTREQLVAERLVRAIAQVRGERGGSALENGCAYAADLIRGVLFIDAGGPVPR